MNSASTTTMSGRNDAAVVGVKPMSPWLGAEITGVDASPPIDAARFAAIRRAWLEHLVIVLRKQTLDEDQQVRFAEGFGPLIKGRNVGPPYSPTNNTVLYISNVRENGELIGAHPDGEMEFHTDQAHQEKPSAATMLYAIDVPKKGGETLFVNAYHAYETLPAELKTRIDGRRAINAYDHNDGDRRGNFLREGIPRASHPMVRTHRETGRKVLYVNRLMTAAIEGMDPKESDDILMTLFAHLERPEFVYAHSWRAGDLVLWDNRCTLHARNDFDASERRLLRRVAMAGETPL